MSVSNTGLGSLSIGSDSSTAVTYTKPNQTIDAEILSAAVGSISDSSSVSLDFSELYKSLTITSKQIVDKLNEILKEKLPDGVQSLKPEEVTPEATSDNIVNGVTSLFSSFAKQNSKLSPEDLVSKFIEQAKKGVDAGYDQATKILGDLGAFEFNGVEDGVKSTKDLITKKLDSFAAKKLEELTGKAVETSAEDTTKTAVLTQAGAGVLNIAA